ncbi:flippase-like domain-containing protein [Alkalispirochaeta americana]|uniref:flippase-like domain-containing protein n=1 Tax=Alkalispirochaeta americana TaxID=159291 RepID=UPI00135669C4|nr:flippase-like domain-containing protein [Alkalispirochaeta americana]
MRVSSEKSRPFQGLKGGVLRGAVLLGGVAVLPYLVSRESLWSALENLGALSWVALAALLLLQVLVLGVLCVQWSLLLASRAPSGKASWLSVVAPYLAGSFVESVTPSAKLGGGLTRGLLFQRRFGIPPRDVALVIALQATVMVLGAVVVLVPAGMLLGRSAVNLLGISSGISSGISAPALGLLPGLGILLLACGGGAFFLVSGSSRLQRRNQKGGSPRVIARRTLMVATALAAAVWVLYPVKVFCAAWALGVPVAFSVILVATFSAYLAGLLPLTPGGLGSYEAVMTLVLVRSGVPMDRALAVTMLSRLVSFWWPLALSAVAGGFLLIKPGTFLPTGTERTIAETKEVTMGSFFLPAVVRLERLAAGNSVAGALYHRCFYRKIIDIEISAAQMRPGSRVLQLGCGPFPMTAIALAERGYRVTAVDRCAETVHRARRLVPQAVQVLCADGLQLDYSGYDAVFVALHVQPRQDIVQRILATADPGTSVLCRNGRGPLCRPYGRVTPDITDGAVSGWSRPLPGTKELVVLKKKRSQVKAYPKVNSMEDSCPKNNGDNHNSTCWKEDLASVCRLCDLAPCQGGQIAAIPDLPMLAAMGLRPGKDCTILAIQPWGGPVICSIGGRHIALERAVAEDITVSSASVSAADAARAGSSGADSASQEGSLVS